MFRKLIRLLLRKDIEDAKQMILRRISAEKLYSNEVAGMKIQVKSKIAMVVISEAIMEIMKTDKKTKFILELKK